MTKSEKQQFNPRLIVYQIVALQCFYYLTLGALLSTFHILFGTHASPMRCAPAPRRAAPCYVM